MGIVAENVQYWQQSENSKAMAMKLENLEDLVNRLGLIMEEQSHVVLSRARWMDEDATVRILDAVSKKLIERVKAGKFDDGITKKGFEQVDYTARAYRRSCFNCVHLLLGDADAGNCETTSTRLVLVHILYREQS